MSASLQVASNAAAWALANGKATAPLVQILTGAGPKSMTLLEQDAEVFIFGERGRSAPKGIAGGGPAAMNVFSYENGHQWHTPPMASKMVGIKLQRGERVRLQTPGGGGYGEASARTAAARERDAARGYVTANTASTPAVPNKDNE